MKGALVKLIKQQKQSMFYLYSKISLLEKSFSIADSPETTVLAIPSSAHITLGSFDLELVDLF